MLRTRGKVVLFYPPYDGPPLGSPLSLLSLAGTLREANFEVVLIDAAIEPRYLERIAEECKSALCIGISVLTGPMIGELSTRPGSSRATHQRYASSLVGGTRRSVPSRPCVSLM